MHAWRVVTAAAIVAAALATVRAQDSQPYSGGADYQVYCSSCHGAGARGDGAIATSLKKRPADLTQLTKRNDGVFPRDQVARVIDGRSGGHEAEDMPKWGDVFAKASESASARQTAERISTLVKYLETLQAR
jgi:mono/diheme cytochrome c family protein